MRTIDIGKLNKRLTILHYADVEDAMGQTAQMLVPLKTVWGSLYPARGAEYYEAQRLRSKTTYKVYIRYIHGIEITTEHYIGYKDKLYAIESVNNVDMANKTLEIYATEYINDEGVPCDAW